MPALPLEAYHIVGLRSWVGTYLPHRSYPLGGCPSVLSDEDLVTILLWNTIVLHQKTLKDLWTFARLYLRTEFPECPSYSAFVDHCHRVTLPMFHLLQHLLDDKEPIKLGDSTMLPVCKLHRAKQHRVAKKIAAFGKNHQGWHYGFKLHASITLRKTLSAIVLTSASIYDGQVSPAIFNEHTHLGIGDSHYGARVMCEYLWERSCTFVLAPPHYKQKKKIAAPWISDSRSVMRKVRFQDSRVLPSRIIKLIHIHVHCITPITQPVQHQTSSGILLSTVYAFLVMRRFWPSCCRFFGVRDRFWQILRCVWWRLGLCLRRFCLRRWHCRGRPFACR